MPVRARFPRCLPLLFLGLGALAFASPRALGAAAFEAGLWWEPLRADLDAYMDSVNAHVSGMIGLKLYKCHARVVTRSSPGAVYDRRAAEAPASADPTVLYSTFVMKTLLGSGA